MKPVIIFGAGQIAQSFAAYLDDGGYDIHCFVVDPEYPPEDLLNWPIYIAPKLEEFDPSAFCFTVGMSYMGLNKPRAEKFNLLRSMGYEPLTFIDERVSITGDPQIGDGSFVMDGNVIQPGVEIGENCILWSSNHCGHDTWIGDHVFIASHAVIGGNCSIGDRCFIGVNATIRDGVKIGADCVIGAGALILSDCEPGGVYGVPGTERSKVPSYRLRGI